ncbi:hypothetical protein BBK82_33070 [Lentzea guizhouensis]|uniref:Uncharacterized protein n=1 Tax=Lentzea guizhouensis TaxID=1586287 RepID=A0A1B2HR13_9PSEU|nr:hypothetical protein [Lentzea guizhouensis]ANZ40151.1 hypothetical protein BBK82_33070 [Lentzea guizhouensis]
MRQEYVAISAAEAAKLKQRINEVWERELLRHFVVKINGAPFSVVGLSRNPNSSVQQLIFDSTGAFEPGDLLSRVRDELRCSVEELTGLGTRARCSGGGVKSRGGW